MPWSEICTGCNSIRDVFKLFDVDGDACVSLVEFLGFPDVDEGPVDWRKVRALRKPATGAGAARRYRRSIRQSGVLYSAGTSQLCRGVQQWSVLNVSLV